VDNMSKLHQTIKGVGEDIENLRFNTAVAKIMELVNWYKDNEEIFDKEQTMSILETLTLLLSPLAPHIAESLWEIIQKYKKKNWEWSKTNSVHSQKWPKFDADKIKSDLVIVAVQINGKMRGTIEVERGVTEKQVVELVQKDPKLSQYSSSIPKKVIYIQDKIINFVI